MDENVEKAAIRARLEAISKDAGLRRVGLAQDLGSGLCRLWGIDPEHRVRNTGKLFKDPVADLVSNKIFSTIGQIPDSSPAHLVIHVGMLAFNRSDLSERQPFSLTDRLNCLRRGFREEKGLAKLNFSLSYNPARELLEDIYDHLAQAIWFEWQKEFPGKHFPDDSLPQTADGDLEEEVDIDAVDGHDELATQVPPPDAQDIPDTPPTRGLARRKSRTVVLTSAVVVLGATVLLIVHPWSSSTSTTPPATSSPGPLAMTITSLQSRDDGYSLALPADIAGNASTFEAAYQRATGDLQPTFERALQGGAYSFGSEVLNLQAHTSSGQSLTITGIHAVNIKRGPVATGAVINDPGGAGGGPNIGFDLDQPTADARTDSNGTLGTPFFQAQLLAVTKTASTALELEFIGHGASYSFNIKIDYLDGQQVKSLILPTSTRSGQPFVGRVSGSLCDQPPNLSSAALAQFKSLQYGRVTQPVGNADGSFTMEPISPTAFKASSCTGG